jgi:small subunit ribosomal protein S17e
LDKPINTYLENLCSKFYKPKSAHIRMGRIKPTLVKRTSRQLLESSSDSFGKTFEENKKALGSTLPSKKMRNKIAGYIARLKRNTKTIIDDNE